MTETNIIIGQRQIMRDPRDTTIIIWSDHRDPFDFDIADVTKTAGSNRLGERINHIQPFGSNAIIVTNRSVWLMEPMPGPHVFAFRKIVASDLYEGTN